MVSQRENFSESASSSEIARGLWNAEHNDLGIVKSTMAIKPAHTNNIAALGFPDLDLIGDGANKTLLPSNRAISGTFENSDQSSGSWRPSWWPWRQPETPKQPQGQKQETPAEDKSYGGIGVGLLEDPQSWGMVSNVPFQLGSLVADGPAAKAGLHNGDVIKKIDGKDVLSLTVDQLTALVRGAPGTKLSITVDRSGTEKTVDVVRQKINPAPAQQEGQRGVTLQQLVQMLAGRSIGGLDGSNQGGIKTGTCAQSPDYLAIINTAAKHMYNPESLGDLDTIRNRFNCEIKTPQDAIEYARRALASTNDRFNRLTTLSDSYQLPSNKRGGIGTKIGRGKDEYDNKAEDSGPVRVNEVVRGSGAEKAGLKKGDLIVAVNGADIQKLPLEDVFLLVRGEPGTNVELTVLRKGEKKVLNVTRGELKPEDDVSEKSLGDGISYIRLHGFEDEKTVDAMRMALNKHIDAKAYVLDLRNNPGGRVDVALDLLALFMKEGKLMNMYMRAASNPSDPAYVEQEYSIEPNGMVIVSRSGGTGDATPQRSPREPYLINGKPLVVLVNEHSASASELFSGALKDNKVAVLIGDKTYGKGIGQSIMQLSETVILSVTSLRYTSPNGYWSGDAQGNRRGIAPDVQVSNPDDVTIGDTNDLQLQKAIEVLKNKLGSDVSR